ncbi:hypothetical protein ACIRPU_33660 [Streptomyces sp. NPDC102259]|uniref:hypothetical protein n=1 Tax=Streptomyces sp. NPDC102259 TaxID=3366148 RepID=UPI0037FCA721
MVFRGDGELGAVVEGAVSSLWSVRAAAGCRLAVWGGIEEVADVIGRLLLDGRDAAVVQETAAALLGREDVIGMRCVLLALSRACADGAVGHLGAALDCDPGWRTAEGEDRLVGQLRELAEDAGAGVRGEARRILAGLRPGGEGARGCGRAGP